MQDGIILIDKPTNMTSFGVVARVRRHLTEAAGKKVKVGHTGTLDPFATGLMIIVVGAECKKADQYTKMDKVYEATFRLGQTSTTADPEGEITNVSEKQPTRKEIDDVIEQFKGEITQTPPMFSAIKINGVRAYKLAREGKQVDIPVRQVQIHELEVVEYVYPSLKVCAHVSSGTYIRTLGVDIGEQLGTGAYCTQLRRTIIRGFNVANAEDISHYERY